MTPGDNMRHWDALARPPVSALKQIKGGRLQGMTDVNPQWRYQAMTAHFGPCGEGWKYAIDKLWTEPGCEGEVLAFALVSLWVNIEGGWSEPIVGVGGNHMIVKEAKGLHANDECWKMAVTDALSVAMKMVGVAASIYSGLWDGSKYVDGPTEQSAEGDTMTAPPRPDIQIRSDIPAAPSGPSVVDGQIYVRRVNSKPTRKAGTTRYDIMLSTGASVATIKDGLAKIAEAACRDTRPVVVKTKDGQFGTDLIDIKFADKAPVVDDVPEWVREPQAF